MIQKPADLAGGEVGVDEQARLLRDDLPQAPGLQLIAEGGRPAALPDDGVVDGLPGPPVPEDGGLPLIGDADGRHLPGVDVAGDLRQSPALRGPDLHGVVLHPARLGVDLAEGILGPGGDFPRLVEEDGPGAGGALVQGGNIGIHGSPPIFFSRSVVYWWEERRAASPSPYALP